MQSFQRRLVSALQVHFFLLSVLPPLLPCVYQFSFFLAHRRIQLGPDRRLRHPDLILVFHTTFI